MLGMSLMEKAPLLTTNTYSPSSGESHTQREEDAWMVLTLFNGRGHTARAPIHQRRRDDNGQD